MKNKKFITSIALIIGVITLSSAVLANYANSNGYSKYKNGLKNFLKEENYTLNLKATLSFDDDVLTSNEVQEMYDKNGDAKLYQKSTYDNNRTHETYQYDDVRVSKQDFSYDDNGEFVNQSSVYVDDQRSEYKNDRISNTFNIGDIGTEEQFDKVVRFGELLADMFVGDLKNNFVLLSNDDGNETYSVELENFQIPEVVNAGVDMVFTNMISSYERFNDMDLDYEPESSLSPEERFFMSMKNSPIIDGAKCLVTVDSAGRLTENILSAKLVGKDANNVEHNLSLEISINVSDYGVTVPLRLDLSQETNVIYASDQNNTRIYDKDEKADELVDDEEINVSSATMIGTIGGADGPTAVYIAQ